MQTAFDLAPLVTALAIAAAGADVASAPGLYARRSPPPIPSDNAMTAERVDLGRKLFFDPRLSKSGLVSCATCHNPATGWSDGLEKAVAQGMKTLDRHTPTILNAAYNKRQMWDGRFTSLEEQALGALANPDEMNIDPATMEKRLRAIGGYRELFERAYPGEGMTRRVVAKAIASFERTVVSGEAPFDRWMDGDRHAVGEPAKRGWDLFKGKAGCIACHRGPNFTDGALHDIGLTRQAQRESAPRFVKVADVSTQRPQKTPSLRELAYTAPYMHTGGYWTLREVVEMYSRGGEEPGDRDVRMRRLDLTTEEIDDIVEFLRSLSGDPVSVPVPALPR